MAKPLKVEHLKGATTAAEVDQLNRAISQVTEAVKTGQVPTMSFTPRAQPDVQLERIQEGFTYYDKTLKKVRTWDGTAWRDHF